MCVRINGLSLVYVEHDRVVVFHTVMKQSDSIAAGVSVTSSYQIWLKYTNDYELLHLATYVIYSIL